MKSGWFMTELVTRTVDDGHEQLTVPLVFASSVLGREICVPVGFVTDLASVPRLPFVYVLTGGTAKKAAVVHDYLYREQCCTRREADAVFSEAMKASGQPWWRRTLMWAGVRLFGWVPYRSHERRKDSR